MHELPEEIHYQPTIEKTNDDEENVEKKVFSASDIKKIEYIKEKQINNVDL